MHATSQLLLRNAALLQGKHVLLFNPPADQLVSELLQRYNCRSDVFTQHFEDYESLSARYGNHSVCFGCWPQPGTGQYPLIILFQPREKALLELQLAKLGQLIAFPGTIWLVGENKAGIKSCGKKMQAFFGDCEKSDAARHCCLFSSRINQSSRSLPKSPETAISVRFNDHEHRYICPPGVFSQGRLDTGSRLLLETLEREPIKGDTLDFGCGCGVLGLSVARQFPDYSCALIDVNALALDAAQRNATGLDNVRIFPSNGFSEVSGRFQTIISNPPFHRGVTSTTGVSRRLIATAAQHLLPGGELRLVANRHLPYSQLMRAYFGDVNQLKASQKFHVLNAVLKK